MKKYLLLLLIIISSIPSITYAAWWNPVTWFSREDNNLSSSTEINKEVSDLKTLVSDKDGQIAQLQSILSTTSSSAVTNESVTKIKVVSDPNDQIKISQLKAQILQLQTQFDLCETSLSSKNTTVNQSVDNSNNDQINKIQGELGTLSQIDFYLDNAPLQNLSGLTPADSVVGTTTLLYVLNNSHKLDGSMLFNNVVGQWQANILMGSSTYTIWPSTSNDKLHQTVQAYRIQLESQLEGLGVVNQIRNVTK